MSARTASLRATIAFAILVAATVLRASTSQSAPDDAAKLTGRLDAATAAAVGALVDEARSKGLPADPLIATALEGAARAAGPERILAAVRLQLAALESARAALDGGSIETEIAAGAAAIRAGVPPDSLARLRAARRGPIVIPMVVIVDMVARGVPAGMASTLVISATRAGNGDPALMRLRENVAHDIGAGASPHEAAKIRTQALLMERGVAPRNPRPPGTSGSR